MQNCLHPPGGRGWWADNMSRVISHSDVIRGEILWDFRPPESFQLILETALLKQKEISMFLDVLDTFLKKN